MKTLTRAQIERLWASDRRGPRRSPKRKKRLDPGRKPAGALTVTDLQNLPAEKWPGVWREVWDQWKEKK